jgi:outer membrane lipoprotein SlyB
MDSSSHGASGAAGSTAASSSPNSTVVAIEVIPRAAGGSETGAGTVAGAAVGGSASGATGSSAAGDRVYRVTLRMDDGSTRVVTQETTPDFRSGDRVNLTGGTIQH